MSRKDVITEINRLFEEKNYEEVIDIVESNFLDRQCLTKDQISESVLLMFLQSLLNIVSNFNNFLSAILLNERDFLNEMYQNLKKIEKISFKFLFKLSEF